MDDAGAILFYDGGCGLCARSVRWALRHDRVGCVKFAPLQGTTYARLTAAGKPVDVSSVVLYRGGAILVRSEAVLGLCWELGGIWRWAAAIAGVVPRGLRDWVYDRIAARRMAWFGGADACRLPEPGEAGRFLP